jgi:hypothetical protein
MLTVRSKDCSIRLAPCRAISTSHSCVLFLAGKATGKAGGARRDRTADLLLAKQAFSQLNYGPSNGWWVWEELHPRPHPYQGCALTN